MYVKPVCTELSLADMPNYSEVITASGVGVVVLVSILLIGLSVPVY